MGIGGAPRMRMLIPPHTVSDDSPKSRVIAFKREEPEEEENGEMVDLKAQLRQAMGALEKVSG